MTRGDFQKLAELRIEEAAILLDAKKYSGAYYLAGYSVECALKACIAKQTKRYDYPDKQRANECYTHDLGKLLRQAGLEQALSLPSMVLVYWAVVKDWNEHSRYEQKSWGDALSIYEAITESTNGVLTWIKLHW